VGGSLDSMTPTRTDDRLARTRLAAALVVGFVLAGPAAASAAPAVVEAGDSARTAAEVRRYWTPQRMENAKPAPVPIAGGAPSARAAEDGGDAPVARAGSISYTSGALTDTLSFPNRVHGKVFFTRPGAGNFVCSGTAVEAANLSTVITAGHCVHYLGVWSTSFAFVPGYRNGIRPYGTWAATAEAAPSQWVSSEYFEYDVGAVVVAENTSGQSLQEVVGARDILFNQPVSGAVRSRGYPAQSPFDGSKLRYCDSALGYRDPISGGGGAPQTMGIGCDMNGGSSGGGWVIGDSGNGAVISVNSYTRSSTPEVMYGPYFGSTAAALYDSVDGDPPGSGSSPAAGGPTTLPRDLVPAATAKVKCKKQKRRGKRKRCKITR
jgi:V8-like Glu-specific endopeptidase